MNGDATAAMVTKIEALFRKANDPAATEPERQAFQAKALALMTKYRIERVDLDVSSGEKPTQFDYDGKVAGSYASAIQQIVQAVAEAYSCKCFSMRAGHPSDPARYVLLFGFKADVDRVRMLAKLFVADAQQVAARHRSDSPNRTIAWRKAFMFGYAAEVQDRFAEAAALVEQEVGEHGTGLVLFQQRAELVEEVMRRENPSLRQTRSSIRSVEGYEAGKAAGRASTVGRQAVGS